MTKTRFDVIRPESSCSANGLPIAEGKSESLIHHFITDG
jgi:hypothetical protein